LVWGKFKRRSRTSRRALLKTVGAGAAVTLGLGAGVAAGAETTSSNCYYEYQCLELICPGDTSDSGSTEERRQCCEDPETGEVTCSDWEYNGCCSLSG
jgi:hypothetical protein